MDIYCRQCGEPYSCVGGLNATSTDMTWWDFHNFIHGAGCPCCHGTTPDHDTKEAAEARHERWMRSLASATDEDTPYPGFPVVWENGWPWGSSLEPDILSILDRYEPRCAVGARLHGLILRSEELSKVRFTGVLVNQDDLDGYVATKGHRQIAHTSWWVRVGAGLLSLGSDIESTTTNDKVEKILKGFQDKLVDWYQDEQSVAIRVAKVDARGHYMLTTAAFDAIDALLKAFEEAENPRILDPDAYEAAMEAKLAERKAEVVADTVERAASLIGVGAAALNPAFFEDTVEVTLDDEDTPSDDELLTKLAEVVEPRGWFFYRNIHKPTCYLAVPYGAATPDVLPVGSRVQGVVFDDASMFLLGHDDAEDMLLVDEFLPTKVTHVGFKVLHVKAAKRFLYALSQWDW